MTLDLAEALPALWADPRQLQQVAVNLVANALDAVRTTSPPHRITLASRFDAERAHVYLDVADTGPGIPPEIQARIFEPFFTTKPSEQGAGLGLSVARGIVSEHGGTILVKGQAGRGAIFRVELPVGGPSDRTERL